MDASSTTTILMQGRPLHARWCVPRRTPNDQVIVLLHQGLGSVTQWRRFPDVLGDATGSAIMAYDRIGHGRSARLEGPRDPDFLDFEATCVLPHLLDALQIERPVLYGHSDGGTIALSFAAAYPKRPAAVISEAAHVFSEVDATGGIAALAEDFQTGTLRAKLAQHHGDNVDAMFNAWVEIWTSPAMRNWSIVDRLDDIICPLLLMQGEADEHGTIAQIDAIASRARGATETWLIPECGHMPHIAQPDTVARQVSEFLRGLPPAR